MNNFNFNAGEYDPAGSFEPLPEGVYLCAVKTAELKPTKAGDGTILTVQFEVLENEHKGRVFTDRFNISNPSVKAQEIGRKQLSALCYSTGVLRMQNPSQLVGIPCQVRLGVRPAEADFPAQNVVKEYRTAQGVKPIDIHKGVAVGNTAQPQAMPQMQPVPQVQSQAVLPQQQAAQAFTPPTFTPPTVVPTAKAMAK